MSQNEANNSSSNDLMPHKFILVIKGHSIPFEIALRSMYPDLTDDESTSPEPLLTKFLGHNELIFRVTDGVSTNLYLHQNTLAWR